jgi:lipoprotein-releasing system ATP-binding protein
MSSNIISANNLVKSFQNNKNMKLEVLKSVSLELKSNEISVIIGASGAGKSTLLHLLAGLDRPDSGNVFYHGQDIFKLTEDKLAGFRNKNVGLVFQFHHLLPEFTALENVAIPQMIEGKSLSAASSRAKKLLEIVGLYERIDHKPAELSGGEQQRVAVARALSNDPNVIFADEPTGNLDSANSEAIHNLIVELRNKFNKTFVIVTHNKGLVRLADKVFEMKDGKLIQS